jgi:hypothetical protein
MSKGLAADELYKKLEKELEDKVDSKFFIDPKIYKSLNDVVDIVNTSMANRNGGNTDLLSALNSNNDLLMQCHCVLSVIKRVVEFQQGGLNNSVETMGDVLRSYNANREEIKVIRASLQDATNVLTARQQGQIPLKELWLQKIEAEESLRILDALEKLRDAPAQVTRFLQQRRYVNAVGALNAAIDDMFNDDLVGISALDSVRQQLMEMKGAILEAVVTEIKGIILGDDASSLVPSDARDDMDNSDERCVQYVQTHR